jgi:hypothetical protein
MTSLYKCMIFYLWLVIIVTTILIFSPPVATHGANERSPVRESSVDNRANIPIVIPVPATSHQDTKEDHVKYMVDDRGTEVSSISDFSASSICNALSITGVTASGDDGNIPSNVLDNNANTRWSNNGVGSWIQLDLGSKKSICSVDIAWYRGNLRQNDFVISVSDNGNSFTNVFTGTSSGTTTSPEKYTMPAGTEGRYLRITVNGNSENDWASITEIAIFGGDSDGEDGVVGTLSHKSQISPGSSTWSSWQFLGGSTDPNTSSVVTRNADGRLEVFVVGIDNSLWHRSQISAGSSTWSEWQYLGGGLRDNSDPAVIINSDGRLQAFAVWTDNALYSTSQISPGSSTWSSWQFLGGSTDPNTSSVVTRNADGRLEVFVVGIDNSLWHRWHTTSDGILPAIKDPNLTVERFVDGLSSPTSATFLDSNNILVKRVVT